LSVACLPQQNEDFAKNEIASANFGDIKKNGYLPAIEQL
jgi:hypothetical protein